MTEDVARQVYPRFLQAIREFPAFPAHARIRVAYSGGPDSTALLLLFTRLRERRRPDLVLSAGHVHHGARGAAADEDAAHCERVAASLGVPLVIHRGDAIARARSERLSFETAAREIRLGAYRDWCTEAGLHAVAVGHSADDQVETVLGNILRGTGLSGLRGMPPSRELVPGGTGALIRPLLTIERAALLDFVIRCGHEPTDDVTNSDPVHRRNRIRHELLPLIRRRFNPSFDRAALGLAREAAERFASTEPNRHRLAEELIRFGPNIARLGRGPARHFGQGDDPKALLDHVWTRLTGRRAGLTRDHYDAWQALIQSDRDGSCYDLPGGWRLERAALAIYVHRGPPEPRYTETPATQVLHVPEWGFRAWIDGGDTLTSSGGEPMRSDSQQTLPEVPADAVWRAVESRDRLRRASTRVRVKELLRARGIPRSLRAAYPVVARGSEVLWIPGLAASCVDSAHRHRGHHEKWMGHLELFDQEFAPAFIIRNASAEGPLRA